MFFTYSIAEIEINLHSCVINDNLIIVNSLKASDLLAHFITKPVNKLTNMPRSPNRPIFSPKRIAEIVKYVDNKVALVYRLQKKGLLPCRKPAPKYIVEIDDIRRMINRTERTAQRIMREVRENLNKTNGEYISVEEFIKESGIPKESVLRAMYLIPDIWPDGYP